MATLAELKSGVVEFAGKGRIVVMGDFNSRVGDIPNSIDVLAGSNAPLVVARSSKDQKVSSFGRKLLADLNSAGMVLLNGVGEAANFTTRGNTVIDLIWAQSGDLDEQVTVEEEKVKLSDHSMVTVSFKLSDSSSVSHSEKPSFRQARWNVRSKGNPDLWSKLQMVGKQIMATWATVGRDQKSEAEEVWEHWLSEMRRTTELGLGYVNPTKPKRPDHDAQLTKLIEQRNAARNTLNRAKAENRTQEREDLRELQSLVRKRLEIVKARSTERRNLSIQVNSSKNPRVYWDLLKQTVGLRKKQVTIPEEVLFEGVVAKGDKI
jgi:hypothetical protein